MALNYGSYAEVVRQAGFGATWSTLPHVLRPLGDLLLGWLPLRPLYLLCAALTVAVSLWGSARVVRRSVCGWSLRLLLAILAVWPYASDRFLWIMLPWILLIGASGGFALWRHRQLHLPLTLLAVVLAIGWTQVEARGFAGRWWGTTAHAISANFTELLPWVRSLPDSAVLATDDEALVWLYTGRTCVPFYLYGYRGSVLTTPGPAEQRAYLERQRTTHILLPGGGRGSGEELDAWLGAYLAWHVAASVLVAVLGRRWAGDAAGLVAGIVFAVHPVHVEAVANVVGRNELMAAVFTLLALYAALERESVFLSAAALAAGLLSK